MVLLCQGIFSTIKSNKSFTRMNPDFEQLGRTHGLENAAFVCVTLSSESADPSLEKK